MFRRRMRRRSGPPKSRPANLPADWCCPMHGEAVIYRKFWDYNPETGKKDKDAGGAYLCPRYSQCGYYISGDERRAAIISQARWDAFNGKDPEPAQVAEDQSDDDCHSD